MVGAVDGASGDGSPTSASALTSSSLPRSLSSGTDDGLEAGRSPNRSTPSSRMNSRDLLLGSQRWPGMWLHAFPFVTSSCDIVCI
jgi:hypothetical protein